MPSGTRLGGQAIFEGEEVSPFGWVMLTWERQREEVKIQEINRIREKRIESTKLWATNEIKKIIDARIPLLVIICIHDQDLCEECREKCGRVGYGWTEFREREGGPPFHHNCRCYLQETGEYGTYLFEGKTVSEEDLSKLNWIREEEKYRILTWEGIAKMQIEAVQTETQDNIDSYFANCRIYVGWYEVSCIKKMGYPYEGKKGTEMTLSENGWMPPYENSTCWPEYIGYEVEGDPDCEHWWP